MIRGRVNDRVAVIELAVFDSMGSQHGFIAGNDTGFTGVLSLPPYFVKKLGFKMIGTRNAELADGTFVKLPVYRAEVLWHDQRRQVLLLEADGGALLGMKLLENSRLTIDVVEDGPVTIEALPAAAAG